MNRRKDAAGEQSQRAVWRQTGEESTGASTGRRTVKEESQGGLRDAARGGGKGHMMCHVTGHEREGGLTSVAANTPSISLVVVL
eukprot:3792937-Rhodomonas_salina.1